MRVYMPMEMEELYRGGGLREWMSVGVEEYGRGGLGSVLKSEWGIWGMERGIGECVTEKVREYGNEGSGGVLE